jgi:hypothetical protein
VLGTYRDIFLCVCTLNPLVAQGEISFEDFVTVSGNTYSVVVNYTNDANTTDPLFIDLRVEVSGAVSSILAVGTGAGWGGDLIPSTQTVQFNGNPIPGSGWNTAPGATIKLGTITFDIVNSGCVALESTSASLLLDFSHPLTVLAPPVKNSDYACKSSGKVNLATGTSSLRLRLIEFSAPGALSTSAVTSGNDYSLGLNQIDYSASPSASLNVFPDSYDELNDNVDIADVNLISNYTLGNTTLQPFQLVAGDANKDSYIDILRVILGTNSPSDMPQPWAYPPSASVPSVTDPVSYPESYDFSDINLLTSLDFTAIKLGDVSIDDPDYDKSVKNTRFFHLEDMAIKRGETVSVPVFVDDLKKIDLLSMSLGFQQDKVELVGVDAEALPIQVNDNYVINQEEGTLNLIWSNLAAPRRSTARAPAFYLKVRAIQAIPSLAELFFLTTDRTTNSAFWADHEKNKGGKIIPVNLSLRWEKQLSVNSISDFVVLTSENPISEEIRVTINSKIAQEATLQLVDVAGRQVYSSVANLTVGDTPVRIRPSFNNSAKGVYVLLISDDSGRQYSTKIVR